MMRSVFLLPMMGLAFAPIALAQPAAPKTDSRIETIIVTAPKYHFGVTPNAIAHDFVKSFASPTVLRNAIARWEVAICPDFEGLAPQYAAVMEARFGAIADEAGVRVKEKGCKPNLSVIFTPQPQNYLDTIRAKNMDVLGYHGTTTVSHPIQAWYVTGLEDIRGAIVVDHDVFQADSSCTDPSKSCWTLPISAVGGWRFRPDTISALLYATIIIDPSKTGSYQVGEIADYVAMMALSRTEDYDDCQLIPSITNLLSPNCDGKLKPSEITASDIAYLRGVYKMDGGATLQIQQNQIAAEMQKSLGGQ